MDNIEITVEKSYAYAPFLQYKIGIKFPIHIDANQKQSIDDALDKLDAMHKERHGDLKFNTTPQAAEETDDNINAINDCITINELEGLWFLRDKSIKYNIAYNLKLKKLTNAYNLKQLNNGKEVQSSTTNNA